MFERFRKQPTQHNEVDTSRRRFVKTGVAAIGTAAVAGIAGKALYDFEDTKSVSADVPREPSVEAEAPVEALPKTETRAEAFMDEIIGYSRMLPLRFDEVQFVDGHGAPIGEPVPIRNIGDIDPGPVNEHGFPTEGISGQWLDAARLELQKQFPNISVDTDAGIPAQYNVGAQFRAALKETDEPALIAGIESGHITRYIDIVNYFADKPVRGAEGSTRFSYVQQKMEFRDSVPVSLQNELRKIMPALCIQESGFNNDVTSKTGAKGIFQFMPDTWTGYGKELSETGSLRTQVEVAGAFFSDLYTQVCHWCGEEELKYLEVQCASHEAFEVELLAPLVVNAYNAGAKRMGALVKKFVQLQKERNTMLLVNKPFDLFAAIVDVVEEDEDGTLDAYGEHARQYVPRIYGHAVALQNLRSEKLASN